MSDSEDELKAQRPQTPPIANRGLVRLMKYLYISDSSGVAKLKTLQEQKIDTIVTLCEEDNFPDEFKYHSYDIEDSDDYDIEEHFDEWFKILADVRDAGGRVVVQCEHAQSPSAACILSYMLKSAADKGKKLPLKQAYKFVSSKKKDIKPNDGFLKQLIALEKELFGESSMRVKGGRAGNREKRKKKKH